MCALFVDDPNTMLSELDQILIQMRDIDKNKVEELVKKRNEHRENKAWEQADIIRAELEDMGIELFDGNDKGWRVKVNE